MHILDKTFPKLFFVKGYKRHHFVLKDLQLTAYRDVRDYEAMGGGAPAFIVCLKVYQSFPNLIIAIYSKSPIPLGYLRLRYSMIIPFFRDVRLHQTSTLQIQSMAFTFPCLPPMGCQIYG